MDENFKKQRLFDNIAFLLKERGMKIGELESSVGVSAGYISRASKENGSTPGVEFIINAAKELGVSVDTLISANMTELTPTEKYIVSFLEKLERDTNADKLVWLRETAEYLNHIDVDKNGRPEHPFFFLTTFWEESEDDYPCEVTDCRFISHSFDVHTAVNGDCYYLRMKNGTMLCIMNISKSVHRINDPDAFAKEVWMYSQGNLQYLCCNHDASPINTLVESLYSAVCENSKHPKIKKDFQYVINAFMQDDIDDDSDNLPF